MPPLELRIDTRRLAFAEHPASPGEPDTPPSPESLNGGGGAGRAVAAFRRAKDATLVPVVSPRHFSQEPLRLGFGASSPFATPRLGPRDGTFDGWRECGLVTRAVAPFVVVDANEKWLAMMGHARGDVVGSTLAKIQGNRTDPATVRGIHQATEGARKATFTLVNYKADGRPFLNRVQISPVFSGGRDGELWPDLYLGLFEDMGKPETPSESKETTAWDRPSSWDRPS